MSFQKAPLNEIRLFMCCHKPGPVFAGDALVPLHVGKSVSAYDFGFLNDATGTHISEKNPYYCELTGLYWIWKNVSCAVVGLIHYRRLLNLRSSDTKCYCLKESLDTSYGLTQEGVQKSLETADLIVPYPIQKAKLSVYQYYKEHHIISDLDTALDVILEKYPEMKDIAEDALMKSTQMYVGNMMIARKKVFDAYAAWVFDILFEVEKRIQADVVKREAYQKRVYGFLAERLMGIWIAWQRTRGLKIKEVPLLFVEENRSQYRRYAFRRQKRRFLSVFGLAITKREKHEN